MGCPLSWIGRVMGWTAGLAAVFHSCLGFNSLAFIVFLSGGDGSSANHHVGQPKQRVELMPVLGKPSIPHFSMAENILYDVEGMLHERPHGGFGFLRRLDGFFLRTLSQGFDRPALGRNLPVDLP